MRLISGRINPKRPRARGVAAIEFALILPFIVVVVLALIDYGYYFYIGINAEEAARAGVRQAVLFPGAINCAAGGPAITAGQATASGTGLGCAGGAASCYMNEPPLSMGSNTTVTLTCLTPPAAPVDPTWRIRVQVDFVPAVGFLKALMPAGSGSTIRYTANITN